jgi:hypothetical protein
MHLGQGRIAPRFTNSSRILGSSSAKVIVGGSATGGGFTFMPGIMPGLSDKSLRIVSSIGLYVTAQASYR